MQKIKRFLKVAYTPITVLIIPHSSIKPFKVKLPSVGLIVSIIAWLGLSIYIAAVAVQTEQYYEMKERLGFYSSQFTELRTTMDTLRKAEFDFRRIFALESKDDILESLEAADMGSIDMEMVKKEIRGTMETVANIRDYLSEQRDIYMSTPKGWPVKKGYISSKFGNRMHPKMHVREFHTGVDIAARPGSPVRATADGIVSYSGWSGANGNLVVIEHGFGYSTCYAHNKELLVKVGRHIKRGDVIAYVGSTGRSTGPHVHYEVWIDRKSVNPIAYIGG